MRCPLTTCIMIGITTGVLSETNNHIAVGQETA